LYSQKPTALSSQRKQAARPWVHGCFNSDNASARHGQSVLSGELREKQEAAEPPVIGYLLPVIGGASVVRTSVTLLGQDMGNTLLITVYTSRVDLQFYSGGYPPE
jgi:hypothetical protein